MDLPAIDRRIERSQQRNREAQARFRQRKQEECAAVEARVRDAQQRLGAEQDRLAELQSTRVALSTFHAATVKKLMELTRQPQPAAQQDAAHSMGLPLHPLPSRPGRAGSPTSMHAATNMHAAAATKFMAAAESAAAHGSSSCAGGRPHAHITSQPLDPARASLLSQHAPATLYQSPALRQAVRPLSAYQHYAAVGYEELVRQHGPCGRHGTGVLAMLEEVRCEAAQACGAAHTDDVCWFMQLDKEVAPGLRLSFSSTVCTPECVATLALHYLVLKLEAALLAAAQGLCDGTSLNNSFIPDDAQYAGRSSDQGTAGAALMATGVLDKRARTGASAAARSDPETGTAAGVAPDAPGKSSPEAASAEVRLRCGVNETVGVDSAVAMIVRNLLRDFCTRLPLATLQAVLRSFVAMVRARIDDRARTFACANSRDGTGGASQAARAAPASTAGSDSASSSVAASSGVASIGDGGQAELAFRMSVKRVAGTVLPLLVQTSEHLGDVNVLQSLIAEAEQEDGAKHAQPEDGRCGRFASLSERAQVVMGCHAVCWGAMLRDASKTIRRVAPDAVFPLLKDYDVETMRVLLYRQLRRTKAHVKCMAHHWNRWRQANLRLDEGFTLAKAALQKLPQDLDLPVAVLNAITAALAEPCSPPPVQVAPERTGIQQAPRDDSQPLTRQRPSAQRLSADPAATKAVSDTSSAGGRETCAAGCAKPRDAAGPAGSLGSKAQCTQRVGELTWQQAEQAHRAAAWLLGASPAVTAAAGRALQRLVSAHAAGADLRTHTATLQLEPGLVFDVRQLVHIFSTHVRFGTVPADIMAVCQLAASQQKREEGWELPFVAIANDHLFGGATQ
eukprot:jgi/Ulvmu1/3586/UM169_0004.1